MQGRITDLDPLAFIENVSYGFLPEYIGNAFCNLGLSAWKNLGSYSYEIFTAELTGDPTA